MIGFFRKYRLFLIGLFLLLLIVPSIFSALRPARTPRTKTSEPIPTNAPVTQLRILPLQKNIIGGKLETNFKDSPFYLGSSTLPNGDIKFNTESPIGSRPNEVITKNGIVVYEKDLTPQDPQSPDYVTLTSIFSSFGQPDRLIKGSKYYGAFLNQYIYASRGFSLVANPNNNEVYEMTFFEPTSVERYISKYGDDITNNSLPVKE